MKSTHVHLTPFTTSVLTVLASMILLTACGSENADKQTAARPGADAPVAPPANVAPSQTDDPIAKGAEAMTEAAYRRHIEILASDEFGGRAPGSPGEELTVDYLVRHFESLELAPANGGSYTQDVPLTSVEVSNKPDLVVSGGEGEDLVLPYATDQVMWTRKQVPESSISDSELVFVGYGINAPERGWNDYAGIDVNGKTVVILINDPGYATQDPELFNGNAMTYYGRWDYKFGEAARQGAVGAIMVHDTLPAAYGWPTVTNSWTGPQFDMVLPDKGEGLASMEAWITRDNAEALFAKAGLDLGQMYEKARQRGFTAVPMDLTASANLVNTVETINSRNVAAILKGSEAPEEIFIYMAHWDHLGTTAHTEGQEGDFIFNGAEDNASGTAGLLEVAQAFAALAEAPRRSVGFLAVTAEESGLLGSKAYTVKPAFPMQKTVAGINMDRLNLRGKMSDVVVMGYGASEMEKILAEIALPYGRTLTPEPTPEKGFYYRSDHFNFAKKGVPILYARGGTVDRVHGAEYVAQRNADFGKNRYHSPADEVSDDWDLDAAIEDLVLFFKIGKRVADSDTWPEWNEGNEFRAIREASLAEASE